VNIHELLDNPYKKRNTVVWSQFTSCSTNIKVAEEMLAKVTDSTNHTLFHINTRYGYDISEYSVFKQEAEVILLPGAHFTVLKVMDSGKLFVVYLEQIEHKDTYKLDYSRSKK